jgi:hypothetical protein
VSERRKHKQKKDMPSSEVSLGALEVDMIIHSRKVSEQTSICRASNWKSVRR